MRMTSKGQLTIPIAIRERLGLMADTEVTFEVRGNAVLIRRNEDQSSGRGRDLVAHMAGRATVSMTTDEILALTRGGG